MSRTVKLSEEELYRLYDVFLADFITLSEEAEYYGAEFTIKISSGKDILFCSKQLSKENGKYVIREKTIHTNNRFIEITQRTEKKNDE